MTYTVTGNSGGSCSAGSGQLKANSATGSCTVSATMPGNNNYNPVNSNSVTVNLQPASQTIAFTTPPPATAAYNTSFTVAATGGASGNPVTFASSGIGVCSVTAGTAPGTATYTMTNSTGTCSVIANQAGNTDYAAASLTESVIAAGPVITVSPSSINFGAVARGSVTTETVTVSNTGTAAATVSTPLLSLLQAGNSDEFLVVNYCLVPLAAGKSCTISVSSSRVRTTTHRKLRSWRSWTMRRAAHSRSHWAHRSGRADNHIHHQPPCSAAYNAIHSGGHGLKRLAVTFTSSGACSNSGATYTMTSGTGTCSVIANQAATLTTRQRPGYKVGNNATKATQTITITTIPASAVYNTNFTVAASASSGLAVTFTSSGSCSNSCATYTMTNGSNVLGDCQPGGQL